MIKSLIQSLAVIFTLFIFSIEAHSQSFEKFLKRNGVELNEAYVVENVKFYLDREHGKNGLNWFDATLISVKGKEYENLKLKFNTIDNSVNIKVEGRIYRIAPNSISGFDIHENGKNRKFRKGFAEVRKHGLQASYRLKPTEMLKYLMEYENFEQFRIIKLESHDGDKLKGRFYMDYLTQSDIASKGLQSYLSEHENIFDVRLDMEDTGLEGFVFLEILTEGEKGMFLKLFSKQSTSSSSVNLARHTYEVTFDKFQYYLADAEKNISRVVFTKGSVKKALKYVGVKVPKKIPAIRSEEKCKDFFEKVL